MIRLTFKSTCSAMLYACMVFVFPISGQAQVQTLSSSSSQGGGSTGTTIGNLNSGNQAGGTGNAQSGLSTMGNFQNLNPQSGFIGRSDDTQNNFIGRTNTQGTTGANNGQNRNFNRATTGGTGSRQNLNNTGQTGPKVPEFRPQLRVAFSAAPLPLSNLQTSMGDSFTRIKERHEQLRNVEFQLNPDHSVTLRGEVESAGAKKLVEFMAMLEPGVRTVKNELTIAAQPVIPAPGTQTNQPK
ncbi:MAG: BON domain-containing protein [Planctomycetaceae bacterium]|nr:BON domain-containing protein [Planctomycetaceae bacterium]